MPVCGSYIANIRLGNSYIQIFSKKYFLIVRQLTSFKEGDYNTTNNDAGDTRPAHQVRKGITQ